jgi:hypothetical protein
MDDGAHDPSGLFLYEGKRSGLDVTFEELLKAVAAEVGAPAQPAMAGGLEFNRAGRKFAYVAGDTAEFRLDPDIAAAALGTPRTSASPRGAGWVQLVATEPEPMDLDRARAWFLSAWRYAGES